jgi:signal transduction histidine kinase
MRLQRLSLHSFFTRIFLSIWAVIVLIAAGAAAVTAIDFAAAPDRPATVVRAAREVLNRDGLTGLRVWLAEHNRRARGQRTLIIDESGKDILGQRLPAGFRALPLGPPREGFPPPPPPGEDQRGLPHDGGELNRPPPDESMRGPPQRAGDDAPAGADPGAVFMPPGRGEGGAEPPPRRQFFRVFGDGPGRRGGLPFPTAFLRGPDGAMYRVLFDPPPRPGPFSPPFSWGVRASFVAFALIASGFISWLLARSISKPVRRLQSAAHTLSAGNLDARAGVEVTRRKDEIGVLGREFDSMAERLSTLIAARQRLLRDISHELRSPLARMEMAIGLARQDPASTPAQLDRVQRESERLDELIGHILEYARLERDPATFTFEELDLAELARQILHDAEFESQSPPGRLRLTAEDALRIRAEPHVLHSAIDNVVRNALLHADPEKPIETKLYADAEGVHISVRDYGPGVLEADLSRIFEPFHRATVPGTRRVSTEGTGIGLAITQRGAALHGGRVAARNADGGGLIVTISLPRSLLATPP